MDISGLLYSRVGYDIGDPMRAFVRSSHENYIPEGSLFSILNENSQVVLEGPVRLWGAKWKNFWWEIDFSTLDRPGTYKIRVSKDGKDICCSDVLNVGKDLLWDETIHTVAIEQMEERARLARNGNGWKDCGTDWREANSHATMIISLCDLLNRHYEKLSQNQIQRLAGQIIRGCDYLSVCQDKAEQVGYPSGAIVHEIPNHMLVIPGDVAQGVVALARASRLLTEIFGDKSQDYLIRAVKAYDYLLKKAEPFGNEGFSHLNHGAPEGFQVPKEWMTRDLLMMVWGGVELWASGKTRYKKDAVRLAREVMLRQLPQSHSEGSYYGHFKTFASCDFTEKANVHHHVGHDTGATFPYYLIPFFEMVSRWYDHPDVSLWHQTIRDFAYGYLLPACEKNPFYLIPEGYFTGHGILNFCGPWHGFNVSLLFGAALAAKLEAYTGDRRFRNIAVGNIQWVAGLNAGLTNHSFQGFYQWKTEFPEGLVCSYSQICGIGSQSVGCWSGIRGSIVNGFSANPQFQMVVRPIAENDGPWIFTDEDWIPHSAGWLTALSFLGDVKYIVRE